MYQWPVGLPVTSNREDLVLPVSIFDDDLNQAINLSGTTTAAIGQAFTGSAWTVTDGSIITTSTTQITIPVFPIGNQLSALALTVGTGLGILPGDPILIADTATGLNTMTGYVVSYVAATGALVVQIGLTFQFEIRKNHHSHSLQNDYSNLYTFGGGPTTGNAPIISASLGNGILIVDTGYLQIVIPESKMRTLRGDTHKASLTMTDSVNTRQLFVATLPVIYGGVTN
jgi:hypothetical protein